MNIIDKISELNSNDYVVYHTGNLLIDRETDSRLSKKANDLMMLAGLGRVKLYQKLMSRTDDILSRSTSVFHYIAFKI